MVSQGLTRSHKVPQGPKRSHKASQGLTRSHKVSQGLTWSHKVSQERIYFRSVWLGSDWFGFAIRSHKRGDISGQSGSDRTGSGLTTDAGDLWTSWGISGQTSLDTSQSVGYGQSVGYNQSVGYSWSVGYPVGRKCVPSRAGQAVGQVQWYTFLRYTARQACRQTCRAIAYNSMESQHGLLVIQ